MLLQFYTQFMRKINKNDVKLKQYKRFHLKLNRNMVYIRKIQIKMTL